MQLTAAISVLVLASTAVSFPAFRLWGSPVVEARTPTIDYYPVYPTGTAPPTPTGTVPCPTSTATGTGYPLVKRESGWSWPAIRAVSEEEY